MGILASSLILWEMLSGCFLFIIGLLYIIFIILRYAKFIPKASIAVFMKASRTLPRNCFTSTKITVWFLLLCFSYAFRF